MINQNEAVVIAAGDIQGIVSIGAWLMAAVVVGIGGLYAARRIRRWTGKSESTKSFTLHELRELHRTGKVSDAEFDLLKRAAVRGAADGATPVQAESGEPAGRDQTADGSGNDADVE